MRIIADLEDAPRGVYCGTVGYLAPPTGTRAARAVQRGDPHGRPGRRVRADRVRGRRRHHVGLERRGRVRRDGREGTRPHRAPAVVPARRDDDRPGRRAGPPPRSPPRAAAGLGRVLRVRRRRGGDPGGDRRGAATRPARSASGSSSTGAGGWRSRPRPRRSTPTPCGSRSTGGAGRPRRRVPVPQDDRAAGLRRGARPPRRGAGRRAHEPARRGDRVHDRQRRGTDRRPVVHAAASTRACCRASVAPWRSRRGGSRSGPLTVAELRAAEEVVLVSDNRGWRRATLVYDGVGVRPGR